MDTETVAEACESGKTEPVLESMDIEDSDIEEVATWQGLEGDIEEELKGDGHHEGNGNAAAGRLQKDAEPWPTLHPPLEAHPSEKRARASTKIRQEAEKEAGAAVDDPDKAIAVYTEAMRVSGATAMMLANRAALLLQQARTCAAVRDCTAALKVNSSFFKAYRIRGGAHGKLGNWKKGHRDLAEAQVLKYDATTEELQKVFASQCRKLDPSWRPPATTHRSAPGADVTIPKISIIDPGNSQEPPTVQVFGGGEFLKDLEKGQAVMVTGLVNGKHLNGKRAVVERRDPRPTARGRWEVEVRLDGGKAEIKSLKRENIMTLNKIDKEGCRAWAVEEKKFKLERENKEKVEEEYQWRKCVEAKMGKLEIGPTSVQLLRKLKPTDALNLLDRAAALEGTNIDAFLLSAGRTQLEADSDAAKLAFRNDSDAAEPPAKRRSGVVQY